MMYHFMFGLRGGSLVAAAPSALTGCSTPAPLSFFSSSWMVKLNSVTLVASKIAIQECDAPLDHVIDDEKIYPKNEYRDHDHGGSAAHFFPRRRGDLAH